jgi:hypothetical protein
MGTTNVGLVPIQHRLSVESAPITQALHQFECDLRVSIPAEVISFDAVRQVVSVQPLIKEQIRVKAVPTQVTLPILDDVPIVLPMGGGFSLTFPIKPGDECDLVFSDMAFDMWWQSGGVQKQPDGKLYRHDIGDAKAHFGLRNQTRVLTNYSTTSAQMRSDDGTVIVDVAEAGVTVTAPATKVLASGGTALPLMSKNFLDYWNASILPFLQSKGYAGPLPPSDAVTSILEAQ